MNAAARRAASHGLRRSRASIFSTYSRRWNSTFAERQWSTPLARTLASAMKVTGPIPIAAFMRQVLTSPEGGYYTSREDVIGKHGDFVTSPEISQVFGELIGIWAIAEWMAQGRKRSGVQLMEVGPGKGTLMDDMLRTFRNFKTFTSSIEAIYLVEASGTLREVQKRLLCGDEAVMEETDIGHRSTCKYFDVPIIWVEDIRLLPHEEGKTPFIFAHEFFDALPIHAFESVPPAPENEVPQEVQEIMTPTGPQKLHKPLKVANTPQWRELLVTLNPKAVEENIEGEPEFQLTKAKASTPSSLVIPEISERYRKLKSQPGSTIEVSPESRIYAADFARRIGGDSASAKPSKKNPTPEEPKKTTPSGAALIMDYGTMSTIPINSLRGIQHHKKVAPLSSPGQVDVSADVDFTALAEAAIEGSDGVEVHGPVEQGDFLQALGIEERMRQLLKGVGDEERKKTLETGWKRLVEKSGGSMGQIYKVMTIIPENGGRRRPVGFGGGVQIAAKPPVKKTPASNVMAQKDQVGRTPGHGQKRKIEDADDDDEEEEEEPKAKEEDEDEDGQGRKVAFDPKAKQKRNTNATLAGLDSTVTASRLSRTSRGMTLSFEYTALDGRTETKVVKFTLP